MSVLVFELNGIDFPVFQPSAEAFRPRNIGPLAKAVGWQADIFARRTTLIEA